MQLEELKGEIMPLLMTVRRQTTNNSLRL